MRKALAEAETPREIGKLIDYAEAAKEACRRAGAGEDAEWEWALFSLEAQREAGGMLTKMPKNPGGRGKTADSLSAVLGLPRAHAHQRAKRWQDVAAVPHDVWTEFTSQRRLSRDRLLREARDAVAVRDREKQARGDATRVAKTPPTVSLLEGDFREVLADLTDVDAIITDPPYPAEYLPLWSDLAKVADRILAPDGVLVVLSGQTHLPAVMRMLEGCRPYRWTGAYLTPGLAYTSMARRVHSNWKPILVYGGGPRFADVVTTDADDKQHHKWGQDFTAFSTIVERLTRPGQLVVDPFLGGGTTAAACAALDRSFIGCDIDADAIATSRRRLTDDER